MKSKILEIAQSNLIDVIRFIDAEPLSVDILGELSTFYSRQPRDIMPEAKTILIAMVYIGKFESPSTIECGRMSRLLLSGFYNNVISPLIPIADYLHSEGYKSMLMEGNAVLEETIPLKGAAVKAGLGWIGKNSLLISENYGSLVALGALLTDADLSERYSMKINRCGRCNRCIDLCPVKALKKPYSLARRECLSHVFSGGDYGGKLCLEKIDSKGYFLECDICQNVCPWNQSHFRRPLDTLYSPSYNWNHLENILNKKHLMEMDEETYQKELVPFMNKQEIPFPVFKRNLQIMNNQISIK